MTTLGWDASVTARVYEEVYVPARKGLSNGPLLLKALILACCTAELTPLGKVCHTFQPQGASAVVLLSESHAAVHTWPEKGLFTLDVFSCKDRRSAVRCCETFLSLLAAHGDILVRERRPDETESTVRSGDREGSP